MSILNKPIALFKEAIFAETDDCGKVSQVVWIDKTHGCATIHVPCSAYDRFPRRACLRALHIKVPAAHKVTNIKKVHCVVKHPETAYYLVRVDFIAK